MKTVKLNWLQKLFHSHNYEYMETVLSNSKGEIWITGCECGSRNKAYFNAEGKCSHVEDITPDEVSALRISYRRPAQDVGGGFQNSGVSHTDGDSGFRG